METAEKIVESYVRHIKGFATIPNLKAGLNEIDLLAINPVTLERLHIEVSVSLPGTYSKLTANEFNLDLYKQRVGKPKMRRTVGFFHEMKFSQKPVLELLSRYGFEQENYMRIIVSWDATPEAVVSAKELGLEIWNFGNILQELLEHMKQTTSYHADETLRTLQLISFSDRVG